MRRFIIVGTPRTGSSALAQIIGFHQNIACGWQWTAGVPFWRKVRAARSGLYGDFTRLAEHHRRHMQSLCGDQTEWLGCRVLFRSSDKWMLHPSVCPPLWIDMLGQHLRWIATEPDIAVIHITRVNNLAWLKSYIFSRTTGIYIGRPYPEELQVLINTRHAVARVRSKHWLDSRLCQLKNTNPYIRVEYESLCGDKQNLGETVVRFLGCDLNGFHVDESKMDSKQASGQTSDGIENYAALELALSREGLLQAQFF